MSDKDNIYLLAPTGALYVINLFFRHHHLQHIKEQKTNKKILIN